MTSNQTGLIDAARELLSSWSQDFSQQQHENDLDALDAPLTPPLLAQLKQEGTGSSGDDTPVSKFRRDSVRSPAFSHCDNAQSNNKESNDQPEKKNKKQKRAKPQIADDLDEVTILRSSRSLDDGDCSGTGTGHLPLHFPPGERGEEEETLDVQQARDAISAVSDPAFYGSRLSDDRIQSILVAAMRYEKDHASTVASRQPNLVDSLESNVVAVTVPNQAPTLPRYEAPPQSTGGGGEMPVEQFEEPNRSSPELDPRAGNDSNDTNDTESAIVIAALQLEKLSAFEEPRALESLQTTATPSLDEGDEQDRWNISIEQEGERVELVDGQGGAEAAVPSTSISNPNGHNGTPVRDAVENNRSMTSQSSNGDDDNNDDDFDVPILVKLNAEAPAEPTFVSPSSPLSIDEAENIVEEEKKDPHGGMGAGGRRQAGGQTLFRRKNSPDAKYAKQSRSTPDRDIKMIRSSSMTESDVGSVEGLPTRLQPNLMKDGPGRDRFLKRLDGVDVNVNRYSPESVPNHFSKDESAVAESPSKERSETSFLDSLGLSFWWSGGTEDTGDHKNVEEFNRTVGDTSQSKSQHSVNSPTPAKNNRYWDEKADEAFDLLGNCSAIVSRRDDPVKPSLVRVMSEPPTPSYAETIRSNEIDLRLQSWINSHWELQDPPPSDGTYDLGTSRTVIVHEINRGDWTWATAWSPNGSRLAVATENHYLAVIETTASTVWRVRHDSRLKGPAVGDTTHSIRSLSWGKNFIAAGGTGNAVSILSPIEPHAVLHVIKGTGFVGSLDWKVDSDLLAIGNRLDKVMIVRVRSIDGKNVESETLFTSDFQNWVNCLAFSPNGSYLAAGNASGTLTVYGIEENKADDSVTVNPVNEFQLDDSVLALDWSPDGRWLYCGGEDFHVTVIETTYWEAIHKINRERWVQCIASSRSGTHVAVGGVSSEISILEVQNSWNSVMGIELKGLVPLSASWHPKDQALVLTGQNNSVLVVETTNARHVKGHHLHSKSPIISVGFSPDGRTAIVGNEAGIVTFFSLSGSTFEVAYELVVILNDRLSIDWSRNGLFAAVGSKDALIIVGPNTRKRTGRGLNSSKPQRKRIPITAGFSVQRVIRNIGETNAVSIDNDSHYVAAAGDRTRIFDAAKDFQQVKSWKTGVTYATAWSPDGHWLATMGFGKVLSIYDTSSSHVDRWRAVFSLKCDFIGYALAWGPRIVGGLVYLAYGGANKTIYIMEIRTLEGTWETVLRIPRDGQIRDLDWSTDGLLAAGIDNGTVTIVDLAYLQSGIAVNEKDYNWQRQALTCFTEIRRNRGKNSIQAVNWIPSAPGSDNLLAVGGTDGEIEIVDLTEKRRCRGYSRMDS